jgi:predicted permease
LQPAFVVVQVAAAVVLLLGTAGTAASLASLGRVQPGFEPDGLLSFRLAAPPARYASHAERVRFFRSVLEAARDQPGVERAGAAHVLPIGDVAWGFSYSLRDRPPAEPDAQNTAFLRVVTPGYFDTLGMPVVAGRDFDPRDAAASPPVVVVSRELARRHWPGASAIGRQLKHRRFDSEYPWMTVVGVVGDVRDGGLAEPDSPTVYLPLAQWDMSYTSVMSVALRSERPPAELFAELREVVGSIDPDAAVFRTRTFTEILRDSLAVERFTATLLAIFAALGLVLAAAGVYAVMAHAADERRRELAIRAALGGTAAALAGLVLRRAAVLAGLGAALGAGGAALMASRITALQPALGPGALHAAALAAVPAAMAGIALLAALLPALRAGRVDPASALRAD